LAVTIEDITIEDITSIYVIFIEGIFHCVNCSFWIYKLDIEVDNLRSYQSFVYFFIFSYSTF